MPGVSYEKKSSDHVLTVNGTTYDGGRPNTIVKFQQRNVVVDPTEYVIQDNCIFWVLVSMDGITSEPSIGGESGSENEISGNSTDGNATDGGNASNNESETSTF